MQHHNVDIQWGNHDILWMGACCGNLACITRVVKNCLSYHNEKILENRYAISLRLLERYALKKYPDLKRREAMILMISIILIKCEGMIILKHPEYEMNEQLKLDKVKHQHVVLDGIDYYFKHIKDQDCCYELKCEELIIVKKLQEEFMNSEKLNQHVKFLYDKGSMYLCCHNTLLYHGCVPLNEHGELTGFSIDGHLYKGKELFDYCQQQARHAYFRKDKNAIDFMFYLWSGFHSPLSGRHLKTFERCFVEDSKTWIEERNPYYKFYHDERICDKILQEFQMDTQIGHIINGHTPVKNYENPVRANGKVIVIDGGFCKNYQKETGIAGYTLISSSHGLRLKAHTPFKGIQRVLKINSDIHSSSQDIEVYSHRMLVKHTSIGHDLVNQINRLKLLLYIYHRGDLL